MAARIAGVEVADHGDAVQLCLDAGLDFFVTISSAFGAAGRPAAKRTPGTPSMVMARAPNISESSKCRPSLKR